MGGRTVGEDASGRRVTLNLIQAIANAQAVGTAPPPFPLVPSEVGGPARPSSAPFVPSEVEQPARPSSALPARPSSAPSVPGEAGGPGRPAQAPARSLPAPTPAPTPARIEASVATIAGFPPVPLTRAEQAEIEAILTRAAARHRAAGPGDAPNDPYVEVELLPPDHPEAIGWAIEVTETEPRQGNEDWRTLDRPDQSAELAIAVAAVTAARKRGDFTTEALLGSGPDQRVEPGETDEPPPAEGRRD